MKTILYLGAEVGAMAAGEVVADRAEIVVAPSNQKDVQSQIKTCDALLDASMKVRITDAMIASATNLKIISCATTGSDHIERGELKRRGIPVRTLMEDKELLLNLTPSAGLCTNAAGSYRSREKRRLEQRNVSRDNVKGETNRNNWLRQDWHMDESLRPSLWHGYCWI
jgi:hypothetical protein